MSNDKLQKRSSFKFVPGVSKKPKNEREISEVSIFLVSKHRSTPFSAELESSMHHGFISLKPELKTGQGVIGTFLERIGKAESIHKVPEVENTTPDLGKKPGKNRDSMAKKTGKKMASRAVSRGEGGGTDFDFFER